MRVYAYARTDPITSTLYGPNRCIKTQRIVSKFSSPTPHDHGGALDLNDQSTYSHIEDHRLVAHPLIGKCPYFNYGIALPL